MKRYSFIYLFFLLMVMACSHKVSGGEETVNQENMGIAIGYPQQVENPRLSRIGGNSEVGSEVNPTTFLPNATVFRMSGDYSKNVGVTISPNGVLTYFPAPSDITADSEPIELVDGWWLNCQGIGPHSVFTRYTFPQYASFVNTPSVSQIKAEIIPGAKVTEFIELPVKMNEAISNPEAVIELLKNQTKK